MARQLTVHKVIESVLDPSNGHESGIEDPSLSLPIVVQSFYGLTFNKLQQKCSQLFLVQKHVLYNILKVSQNLMGGSVKIEVTKRC